MDDRERFVLYDRLLFGGAMGASLSHEFSNVFAILGELNGLIEDLVDFRGDGGGIHPDRLKGITDRVAAEVRRGHVFVRQLNRFSHSAEGGGDLLDAGEVLSSVVELGARFARLRKVGVRTDLPETPVAVRGARFDLQHLLFRCLELALSASAQHTTVDISLSTPEEGIRFELRNGSPAAGAPSTAKGEVAQAIAEHLGGRVEVRSDGAAPTAIVLTLPPVLRTYAGATELACGGR
jgi:signal transduction histidine kinase